MSNEKFDIDIKYYFSKHWARVSGCHVKYNKKGEIIFIRPDLTIDRRKNSTESRTLRNKRGKIIKKL